MTDTYDEARDDDFVVRDLGVGRLSEVAEGRSVSWENMAESALKVALSLIMQQCRDTCEGTEEWDEGEWPWEVARKVAWKVLLEMLKFDTSDGEEGLDFYARWPATDGGEEE